MKSWFGWRSRRRRPNRPSRPCTQLSTGSRPSGASGQAGPRTHPVEHDGSTAGVDAGRLELRDRDRLDRRGLKPDEGNAPAALERLAPERRATVKVVTPAHAAEYLQTHIEAGFSGFIFRNMQLTPDAIPLVGELIRLMS